MTPRTIELAVIFLIACLATLTAWELDHGGFAATFAAAAAVAVIGTLRLR
jgi:hypothetical protein